MYVCVLVCFLCMQSANHNATNHSAANHSANPIVLREGATSLVEQLLRVTVYLLPIGAAAFAGVYKVLFKRLFGAPNPIQVEREKEVVCMCACMFFM